MAPTSPSVNLTGTWKQLGGTRTWALTHITHFVGGTSSFSQHNSPYLGVVSGTGTVQGGFLLGSFEFEDFSTAGLPQPFCYVALTGKLTVSSNSMTGSYTETDGCNGTRLGQSTGSLTMQKQ